MKRSIPLVPALRAVVTFTLLCAGVNVCAQQAGPSAADVPVREVVLFSSGVGYFQHEGSVTGDASTQLRFKTGQINDILKSLVLQDLNGGRVGVVTYPSQDPLAKTLGSFQVDISDNPSLGDLLNKLRGARIALTYSGHDLENFSATVLGVEKRQVPGAKAGDEPLTKEFLNVVAEHGIRSLELDKIDRFQLEDAGLQEELTRALAAVAGARDQDKKPVDIRFDGTGERRVRLGYVVETPIWKASYRLVLSEDHPDDKKPKATLQGWAIVENQTDNDWNNVRLSLVSGRPISFTENLYQPLYVPRPEVTPELYASLRPQTYEGGQGTFDRASVTSSDPSTAAETDADAPAGRSVNAAARRQNKAKDGAPAPAAPALAIFDTVDQAARDKSGQGEMSFNPTQSVTSITDAAKVGELFQYTVGNVSLTRQRSAMIPIINDPVEVEKVSIFNQSVLGNHPLNGARLKNTTADAKHLLGGPVTVFDEGSYAGDAQLDNVPPGETRLLSYGIDLQVSANVKDLQEQQSVTAGKIVKGALILTRKAVSSKEYSFENKSDHDKTMVIEHALRAGWGLVDTPKPIETTNALYRFQQEIGVGKTERFIVKEESVQNQTISILSIGVGDTQVYSQTGEIPKGVREALAKAIAFKQAVVETQRQLTEHDQQINALTADQSRIRENIRSVDRTTSYATRLLKKLDDQESQIDKLRNETEGLHTKLDGQNRDLQTYLNGLSVE